MQPIIQLVLFLSMTPAVMADPIYRYEDAEGKTVYTDTRPDEGTFQEYKPKALFVMTHKPPTAHARYYNLAAKGRISPLIQNLAQQHEMDPFLVEAVVRAESDYDPLAVSRAGAQGLMQIMPKTGISLGLSNPFDPQENLDVGIRHLKKLMAKYENNLDLALAAYNAGEMSVQKYKGVPPYPETIDYIQKIKKYYSQFSLQSSNSLGQSDVQKPVPYL
jgi:soluble lytic murein transglycosylase-like protein